MIRIEAERGFVNVVEDVSELPDLSGAKEVFLDVETTAFDDYGDAFYPYHGNRICGTAVTVDDHGEAWYVPVRHRDERGNLPVDNVQRWYQTLPKEADWINHNIKFDAHFMRHDGYEHEGRMIDTVVLAKMIDSDRMGHQLKPLARDWLGLEMEDTNRVDRYLAGLGKGNKKFKDYAAVPIDILGEYAGMDVLANRDLYRFCCHRRVEQLERVWNTEILLTPVLYDMECEGMRADQLALKREAINCLTSILEKQEQLERLSGCEFTNSNAHLFDILCNQFGLPVLSYNDNGNVSFDADALAAYSIHPQVIGDPTITEFIETLRAWRTDDTFNSLFLQTYIHLMDEDGFLHPSFNQLVRTGRMSCRQPNAQQLNKRAKKLMIPPDGHGILRADASQIEFRLIGHYLNDEETIRAYNEDPNTDFHQWVADNAHMKRPAGKTLNFAMGYGAGKKKVTAQLSADEDIMREVGEEIAARVERGELDASRVDHEFKRLCADRAEKVYYDYHARFPQLKKITSLAAKRCKLRGFVFNAFGRRRHLPARASYSAFNSVIQGGAMDYIKTRMVALAPRYNSQMRSWGIKPFVNVHDELAWYVPLDIGPDPQVLRYIYDELCVQEVPFRIPFTWDMGWSARTWAEASGDPVLDENGEWIAGQLALAN